MTTMDKAANMAPTREGFNWAPVEAWLREYYWIVLIVGVLVVSIIASAIMVCVCRTQLSRGLSQRFTKSFVVKRPRRRTENSVYLENSIYHVEAPPLPSRHSPAAEENNYYSYVDPNHSTMKGYNRKSNSQATFSYIDVLPAVEESDYDDAIILPQRLRMH